MLKIKINTILFFTIIILIISGCTQQTVSNDSGEKDILVEQATTTEVETLESDDLSQSRADAKKRTDSYGQEPSHAEINKNNLANEADKEDGGVDLLENKILSDGFKLSGNDNKEKAINFDFSACSENDGNFSFSLSGNKIGGVFELDLCIEDIAKDEDNIFICDRINKKSYQWACYSGFAQRRNDSSICDVIDGNSYHKIICYEAISKKNMDPSMCEKMKDVPSERDGYDYDVCYGNIATLKNDPSYCEKIIQDRAKGQCYSYFGFTTNDMSYCDILRKYEEGRHLLLNNCYIQHAIKKRDKSICEKVEKNILGSPEYQDVMINLCNKYLDGLLDGSISCELPEIEPWGWLGVTPFICS